MFRSRCLSNTNTHTPKVGMLTTLPHVMKVWITGEGVSFTHIPELWWNGYSWSFIFFFPVRFPPFIHSSIPHVDIHLKIRHFNSICAQLLISANIMECWTKLIRNLIWTLVQVMKLMTEMVACLSKQHISLTKRIGDLGMFSTNSLCAVIVFSYLFQLNKVLYKSNR